MSHPSVHEARDYDALDSSEASGLGPPGGRGDHDDHDIHEGRRAAIRRTWSQWVRHTMSRIEKMLSCTMAEPQCSPSVDPDRRESTRDSRYQWHSPSGAPYHPDGDCPPRHARAHWQIGSPEGDVQRAAHSVAQPGLRDGSALDGLAQGGMGISRGRGRRTWDLPAAVIGNGGSPERQLYNAVAAYCRDVHGMIGGEAVRFERCTAVHGRQSGGHEAVDPRHADHVIEARRRTSDATGPSDRHANGAYMLDAVGVRGQWHRQRQWCC